MRRHFHVKRLGRLNVLFSHSGLLFSSAAIARIKKPLDLSGLWVRDDGGVVRLSQEGQKSRPPARSFLSR